MEFPYTPVIGLARTVFFLQGLRFTILGEENVPAVGGAVMAINHTGYFDFTYAGLAARPRGRLVRFMAKKSVFGHRVTGPLMRGMKHIPVDRHAGQGAIEAGLAAVRAGEIVGIFPEATMSRSFELKPFKGGAARIARDGGVPLLPTTLWGSQRVWTKDAPKHRLRSNTPIHITVGQPMHLAADADLNEATEQLRLAMAGNLLPSRRHTRG
jgi:1-acyl-sn-glycerol-3-phosphate acyltransferase